MSKFIDCITILVKAGNGGSGCASSYQDQLTARVFMDGGSGGRGGDVFIVGDRHTNTLISLCYDEILRAGDGLNGSRNNCTGACGYDRYIKVPLGTVAYINNTTYDILDSNPIRILSGGNGGRGSSLLKSKIKEDGVISQEYSLKLTVKTIGDVGFLGLPNAGKSSLLNTISNASVQVGSYAFTTTKPQLGVWNNIIFVDLPGLIENANLGKGMGFQFLSHIERCKVLVAIIDVNEIDPIKTYNILCSEIKEYGIKNEIKDVVLTKIETSKRKKRISVMRQFKILNINVHPLSSHKKIGINNFLYKILQKIQK